MRVVVASCVAPLLAVSLIQAPALAKPEPGHLLTPQFGPVLPARKAAPTKPPTAITGVPYRPVAPVWPAAGAAEVDLAVTAGRSSSTAVRAAGVPVLLGEPAGAAGARSAHGVLTRARVQVYDRRQALTVGVDGMLLRVSRADGVTGAGATRVGVDYASFASAYGADWSARLRLVQLPECALTTPQLPACRGTVLRSTHNTTARTVSADVTVPARPASLLDSQHAESRAASDGAAGQSGILVALTAGTSSGAGDYAATSLQPSSTWSAGGNSGGFSWSYPMRVPPSLGGPAPKVALSYSSQSVDGRMAASNNQPSWVGEGFEFSPGFIERRYRSCGKDMTGGNNTVKTGDLCWATDNAILSLNGAGGELLFKAGEEWRIRSDDGSRVQRKTGGPNGDNNGEYWVVTTPDGTQYWFGGRSGSNATWTVPVFGNHAGEPCRQSTFAASHCVQAWRWNLDYVVDARGNTMTYTYVKETNRYARNNTATDAALYDRGGYLDRIEYGTRSGSAATAPMRVQVTTADRCLSACTVHDAAHWPDTPWDTNCTGSPCSTGSPTFWTARRLAKVTTQLWSGSGTAYSNVESWTFTHTFPDPGDATRAGLWLERISHTGHVGGDTSVPNILFQGVQMPNRVDTTGDWAPAMNWWRIQYITTETGGSIAVSYAPGQCVAGSVIPAQVHNNLLRCYPVKWTPEGYTTPVTDWMHKYVVTQVSESDLALPANERSVAAVTRYQYVGDPAWHYTDDDGLIDADDKTWSVWRGYGRVRTLRGDPGPKEMIGETRYFRGMHGDRQPSGTRTVTLPAVGTAPAVADEDAYTGMVRETISFNAAAEVSAQVSEPWQSPANATRSFAGTTVSARHTGTAATWTRTARDNGRPARTTTSRTTFDAYGMPVTVDDAGDDAVSGDERCQLTGYEPRNTTAWLILYPHRIQTFDTSCTVAANGPLTVDDIVDDLRGYYDQASTHGTAPTTGLISKVEDLKAWTPSPGVPGTPTYRTVSTAQHDAYGRTTSSTDVRGNTTTTGYPHNGGGQLATVTTTNHLSWQATATLQPAWGSVLSTVDPNGRRTDLTYDGLGRTTAMWLPGRDKTGGATATTTFGYLVRNNSATVVTTSRLVPDGGYHVTQTLYDSLARPRQTQTTWGVVTSTGRVITDTFYDSAGRGYLAYGQYAATGAPSTDLYPKAAQATMPNVTETLYDGAGRPTNAIFLINGVEKWRTITSYGGDRTDTTPPAGGTATSTIVDARGRATELRQYHGTAPSPWTAGSYDTTRYGYNRKSHLTTVTDPVGNHWDYGYDLRGRPTQTTDPDTGTTTYTFNNTDDLTSTTDSRSETLAYTYDSLGRPTSLRDDTANGPKRAEWTYDTLTDSTAVRGLPVKAIRYADPNTDGTPDPYTFEILGYNTDYTPTGSTVTIPAAETGLAGTYQYGHTYWPNGSPSTTTLPDLDGAGGLGIERLSYRYNTAGLPTVLGTNFGGIANNTYVIGTTYTEYNEPTLIGRKTSGASLVEQVRYYEEGTRRLKNINTSRVVSPSSVAAVAYSYDPAGNITKISNTTAGDHQCLTHDRLRRLTEAWTPSNGDCTAAPTLAGLGGPAKYWSTWTHDTVGNRKSETAYNPGTGVRDTTNYTHPNPGANQPHTLISTSGATTGSWTYDPAGNTKTRPTTTAGQQTLTWDAEGHLDSATDSSGGTTYLYDADGNRLIRRDPTGKTLYLPGQELRHTTATNTKATSRYYSWNGDTIAVRTSAGLTWLAGDQQNTASHAITATTQTVATRRQTPYGGLRGTGGTWPAGMNHGFVGGTNDNTGLTHLGAREYDPSTGRFISADPLTTPADPQQLHGYAYANNNPTTYTDPDGLCPCVTDGGGDGYMDNRPDIYAEFDPNIGAGVGGVVGAGASKKFRKDIGKAATKVKDWFTGGKAPAQAKRIGPGALLNAAEEATLRGYGRNIGAASPYSRTGPGRYFPGDDFPNGPPILKRNQTAAPPKPPAPPGGKGAGPGKQTTAKPNNTGTAGPSRTPQAKNCTANSFVPGTKVVLADGRTKPIQNVAIGDHVLATDTHTGRTEAKTVAATITGNGNKNLVRITIYTGGPAGQTQGHIVATDGHPFWLPDRHQWIKATDLQPGQWLQTSAGTWVQITAIQRWTQTATVHNLTVTDIHTYYVVAGTTPVLVHNCGEGEATVFLDPAEKHASIRVDFNGNSIHTEQLGTTGTAAVPSIRTAPHSSAFEVRVPVPQGQTAQSYQEVTLGRSLGDYDEVYRSCVTYCGDVLRAGGVEGVPTTTQGILTMLWRMHGRQ